MPRAGGNDRLAAPNIGVRFAPSGATGTVLASAIAAATPRLIATMFEEHRAARLTRLAAATRRTAVAVEIALILSDVLTRPSY